MPRALTRNEVEYIYWLTRRNYSVLSKDKRKADEIWCKGLSDPMPSSERMMRHRIRKKAIQMAIDLCLIWDAGIAPGGEVESDNVVSFVQSIDLQLALVNGIWSGRGDQLPRWVGSILKENFKGLKY